MFFAESRKFLKASAAGIVSAACVLSLCSCALFSAPETTFSGDRSVLDSAPQIAQQKDGEAIKTLAYVMKNKSTYETLENYFDFRGEKPKASFIVFSTKSGEKKELSRVVYNGEKTICVVNGEEVKAFPPEMEPSILFASAVAQNIYSVARHVTVTETEDLGNPCYKVDVYPKKEFDFVKKFIIFLDKDTKCIVRQDASMSVEGTAVIETVYYSDFRDYGGFKFYGKSVSDRDFVIVTLVTDSVTVNKAIPPEVFTSGLPEKKEAKK